MTEIETVTVTFEDLKANLDPYMQVKETKRLVVTRDGEQVAVLGLRLPSEERGFLTPRFFEFLDALFPEEVDMTNRTGQALEEQRGNLTSRCIRSTTLAFAERAGRPSRRA
jgi:hypothetical protein